MGPGLLGLEVRRAEVPRKGQREVETKPACFGATLWLLRRGCKPQDHTWIAPKPRSSGRRRKMRTAGLLLGRGGRLGAVGAMGHF